MIIVDLEPRTRHKVLKGKVVQTQFELSNEATEAMFINLAEFYKVLDKEGKE